MGGYQLPDGRQVQFTDGDTLRDAADLWAVVPGEFEGTPSTESDGLKAIIGTLQSGRPLGDSEWVLLTRLLDKYRAKLEAFRAGPDNSGEGFVPLPQVGQGRIKEAWRMSAADLYEAAKYTEESR